MRRARLHGLGDGEVVYHLVSRTVNGQWLLKEAGKEVFRKMMWQVAEFCGLEILTYTVLSNHFHILVVVTPAGPISDEELLRRYLVLYPQPTKHQPADPGAIAAILKADGPEAFAWRQRQLRLMHDVSAFMKLLKERFSIWFNKRHNRFGPVWSDRFRSTLVEPQSRTVRTMAAYIDLNSVRAGITSDPANFRFSGYAQAVAGDERARRGIQAVVGGNNWEETQAEYRKILYLVGASARAGKAMIPLEEVQEVLRTGGQLPLPQVLRCRIKYFTYGAVLGGREFVEAHASAYRERFRCSHRVATRELPQVADWGVLTGLRPVRGSFIG